MSAARNQAELEGVTLLGNQNTTYSDDYAPEVLETFVNKHPDNNYVVTFDAYEFTSKCVVGDTLISIMRPETCYPEGTPIKDLVGTQGYVYGVDDTTLETVCRPYTDVRKTGEQVPVVKIIMDNIKGVLPSGAFTREVSYVRCTPDHLVLVKKGLQGAEWVPASELQPGMKLVASQNGGDMVLDEVQCRELWMDNVRPAESSEYSLPDEDRSEEICRLYEFGYLTEEIGEYLGMHPNSVLDVLKSKKVVIKDTEAARSCRQTLNLPALDYRVVQVVDDGVDDVYNMEVADVHNFFGNDVILHNCPKTGQPDFAKVIISYIPDERMVESKSLKLYLFSFRNHGSFHEDCMNMIMKDLIKLMEPKYIEVFGIFAPRGGIAIHPWCAWVNPEYPEFNDLYNSRMQDNLNEAAKRTRQYAD